MILLFCFLKQFPFLFNCSSLLFVLLQSFVAPSHFIVNRLPNRIAMCHRWLHCVFSPQDGRRCQLLATLAIVGRLLAPLLATSAPNETNTSITSIRPYFAYAQAHFVQIRRRKQFFVDHNSPSSFSNKSMNHLICHISQSHSLNQTPIFAFENICETVLIKQTNVCNDQRRLFVKHQWNVEHSVKALFSTNIDSILFSSHSNLFEIECLSRAIRRRRQKQQEAAPSQRQCHEQNRIVSTNLSISLSLANICLDLLLWQAIQSSRQQRLPFEWRAFGARTRHKVTVSKTFNKTDFSLLSQTLTFAPASIKCRALCAVQTQCSGVGPNESFASTSNPRSIK